MREETKWHRWPAYVERTLFQLANHNSQIPPSLTVSNDSPSAWTVWWAANLLSTFLPGWLAGFTYIQFLPICCHENFWTKWKDVWVKPCTECAPSMLLCSENPWKVCVSLAATSQKSHIHPASNGCRSNVLQTSVPPAEMQKIKSRLN